MDKKSFVLHYDSLSVLDKLTNEQCGKLLRKMKSYHNGNSYILNDIIVEIAFEQFKNQFDRDKLKFENVCERNKNNGKLGGRPKKQNKNPVGILETQRNPKKPRNAESDNDSDNDSDKEKDNNKYIKEFIEYISTEKNTATYIVIKYFLELGFMPKENVESFRNWLATTFKTYGLLELTNKELEQKMLGFYTYRKEKKKDNPNWKSTLINNLKYRGK